MIFWMAISPLWALSDYLEIGLCTEDSRQSITDDRVIVNDKDADGGCEGGEGGGRHRVCFGVGGKG